MVFGDYQRFKDLWAGACEISLGKKPSESALSLAFGVLAGYSFEDVRAATIDCLKDSAFKPTPAAVLEQLNGGSPDDRATQAYGAVLKALRRIRSGESVRFDDPAIHYALEQGCNGWTGFAQMTAVDSERIFTKYYAAAVRLGKKWGDGDVPDHMAGERERRGSVLYPWSEDQIVPVATQEQRDQGTLVRRIASAGA